MLTDDKLQMFIIILPALNGWPVGEIIKKYIDISK